MAPKSVSAHRRPTTSVPHPHGGVVGEDSRTLVGPVSLRRIGRFRRISRPASVRPTCYSCASAVTFVGGPRRRSCQSDSRGRCTSHERAITPTTPAAFLAHIFAHSVAPADALSSTLPTYRGVHDRRVKPSSRFLAEVDFIVPSKAWERGMRCKEADLKPFVGTLRVESPSGSA